MNAIIIATSIIAMYLNSAKVAMNGNGEYYYNADIKNNKVCMLDVYHENDDKILSRQVEYRFAYDSQDRLLEKEAYK